MADNLNVTPGGGAVVAADDVAGVLYQRIKPNFGTDGAATDVSLLNPLPVRDPVKGNALSKGGANSALAAGTLVAANTGRTMVEISNGGASGVWLAFGSTAVAGQGTYLPAKATGYWPTTATVSMILEASGTAGPVGYTEW